MERNKIIKSIIDFEGKYDVASWKINDIHIWPVIRLDLFFSHWNKHKSTEKIKRANKSSLIQDFLYSIFFILKKFKKSNVVFAGANSHRSWLNEKNINKYFDPLLDYLEDKNGKSFYLLEYDGVRESFDKFYKKSRIIELYRILHIAKIFERFRWKLKTKKFNSQLLGYNAFLIDAEAEGFEISGLKIEKLERKLSQIETYSTVFEIFFKKVNATHCFALCYYSKEMLAFNLAAYRLGVKSFDMQHGTQGPLHVAYTKWSNIPTKGYELLPKTFWCWDEDSCSHIGIWTDTTNNHSVIAGGNPWLSYLTYAKNNSFELPEKIILYTLQPIAPILDDYILKVIAKTANSYNWFIRLHPRQMHQYDTLIKLLEKHDLKNKVNIKDATDIPLPDLLKRTTIHISKFSGSILEAAQIGVPTIIIDEIGVASFNNLINHKLAFPLIDEDSTKLIELIEELGSYRITQKATDINDVFLNFEDSIKA
ncbi:hypothetical protein [Pontibacter ramchanderi]|uniref:Capsular polysaccharide biosynthesis protein n=1 Tax=Pontibacter ramchanderi TaxID=1179743 RepID=A0A2N3U924_9BACT|nr:hypothetical protein [Pontibacter ramchanderi]PKV63224.1 hypothetical protein BD749_3063 [Pontibacter ramchanderi]